MRPLLLFDAAKRDPTGTSGIRAAFRTAGRQRLHLFTSALNRAVTEEDRLGLNPGGVMAYHSPAIRQDAFANWLGAAGASIAASGWSRPFLAQAWNKGVLDASFDLGTPLSPQADSSYLEVLCDHEVRGVIAAVNQQLSRAAELAISKRMQPGAAYRALKSVFDKVADPRLHLIAHVLTVRAYNDGKLQAYHSAGVTHVGVVPEWLPQFLRRDALTTDLQLIFTTQGDDRVCDECDEYADDSPYTIQDAIGIIPVHPNCRCTWTPFIETGKKHKKYADALTADIGWTKEAREAALEARQANKQIREGARHGEPMQVGNQQLKVTHHEVLSPTGEKLGSIRSISGNVQTSQAGQKYATGRGETVRWRAQKGTGPAVYFSNYKKALKYFGDAVGEYIDEYKEEEHPRVYAGRWTSTPDDWKQTGPRRGSNPGGLHVNQKGEEWYVKTPPSADHIHSDVLANELYRLAGVAVPEEKLTSLNGKPALASRILPGARTLAQLKPAERANVEAQLRQHVAVDAWLANWDVVGLEDDNVLMTPDGKAYRVDQGGALRYRAQGGLKPKFDFAVDEINTLRNPKMGPNAARVFGPMSKHEVLGSIDKVLAIPDASIRMLAANHGQQKVGETLIKRKEWLSANRHAFVDAGMEDAAYDPMLHPHAGTGTGGGQFIETGGGVGGAGKKTLWVASTNGEAHAFRVDKVLKMDVKRNNNYRWQVQQFINEAKKLGGGHLNQIPALKLKIATSFVEHAKLLKKKGDAKGYVPGFLKKAVQLGYSVPDMGKEMAAVKAPLTPPKSPDAAEKYLAGQAALESLKKKPDIQEVGPPLGKDPDDEDEPEITALEPEDPSHAILQAKILYKEGMKTAAMLKVQKAVSMGLKGPALAGALGPEMTQGWLNHLQSAPPSSSGSYGNTFIVPAGLPPTVAKIVEAWNVENYGKPADLAVLRSQVAKALGAASAAGGLSGKNWQQVYNEWAAANGFGTLQVEPETKKPGESITKLGTAYALPKSQDEDWNKKIEAYNTDFADTPADAGQKKALKEVLQYGYSQVQAGDYNEWAKAAGFDPQKSPDEIVPESLLPKPLGSKEVWETPGGGIPEEAFAASPEPTPEQEAASAAEFEKLKAIHEANKAAQAKQPGEPTLPTLQSSPSEMAEFAGKVGLAASQVKAALKTTPTQVTYGTASPTVQKLIAVFNAKWANEPVTTVAELKSKVKDYETFKNNVMAAYEKEKGELQAKQQVAQAEKKAKQAEQQAAALAAYLPTDVDKNNYKVLTGVVSSDYAKAYIEYSAAAIKKNGLNITPVEGAIIRAYTASFYREINESLRQNATTQQVFDFTEALNTALDKLPAHVGVTYRKTDLPGKVAALYKKGSVIYERAFTSSSTSEGVWSGDYRYVIHGTNGRDVKPISEHTSEKEVLYKSNSVFRVLNVEGHTIHLEQIK